MRASLICNSLALLGFAWLIWMNFFRRKPNIPSLEGHEVLNVDAGFHIGVTFLVPFLLLLAGVVLQFLATRQVPA